MMFKLGGRGYHNLEAMKMRNMLKYSKHSEDYDPSNFGSTVANVYFDRAKYP